MPSGAKTLFLQMLCYCRVKLYITRGKRATPTVRRVLYLYDHEKKKKLGAKQAHASLTASGPHSTVPCCSCRPTIIIGRNKTRYAALEASRPRRFPSRLRVPHTALRAHLSEHPAPRHRIGIE
jgi:hypothetical protein